MPKRIVITDNITTHWLWKDAEKLKWWLDLLFMATDVDRVVKVGRLEIELKTGQIIASVSDLCKRWDRSRAKIEPFLLQLINEGMIEKKVTKNISILTVNKGEKIAQNNDRDAHLYAHLVEGINGCKTDSCKNDVLKRMHTFMHTFRKWYEKSDENKGVDAHLYAHLLEVLIRCLSANCVADVADADAHLYAHLLETAKKRQKTAN